MEGDPRVFYPAVIDCPSFTDAERGGSHDGGIGKQAEEAEVRVTAENELSRGRQVPQPCPCLIVVGMGAVGQCKPDIYIREE